MILTEVDPVTQERRNAEQKEFRVEQGEFVGVVQPYHDRYKFFVRDLRRERPTIHGFGVDFPEAIGAVRQLLDSLGGAI